MYYIYKYACVAQSILRVCYARSAGLFNTRVTMCGHRLQAHFQAQQGIPCPPTSLFVSLPHRDEALRAVTQLPGWVVSSQCSAEIRPPSTSSLYSGLFVCFCPDTQNNSSGDCGGEASVRGRAVMTEERCAKVSDQASPQGS